MSIVNRALDSSEQKRTLEVYQKGTVTGQAYVLGIIPHAATIVGNAKHHGLGLSGAPTSTLQVSRFVVGAGLTTFAIGPALTVVTTGTSGLQSLVVSAPQLQAGDILQVAAGAANAALTDLHVQLVIQALQDIKSWN